MLDGDIRPIQPEASRAKGRRKHRRVVVSREEVEALRPARTEIIVCTGLRTRGGWQIWGDVATGIFHDRRQKGLTGVFREGSAGTPPAGRPSSRFPLGQGGRYRGLCGSGSRQSPR